MKQLREILQTYTIILFSGIHVILITRFCVDFFGTSKGNPLVRLIYNISNFISGPFQDTFEASVADNSLLNYSILYAIIIYTFLAVFVFLLYKVFFKVELREKSLGVLNLFFATVEALLLIRIVSDTFNAQFSSFYKLLVQFTNLAIKPIDSLSQVFGEVTNNIAIGISLILIAIIWFTANRILTALTDTVETITTQTYKPPKYKPRKLKTTIDREPAPEAKKTEPLQEQVSKPEDYIEPKVPVEKSVVQTTADQAQTTKALPETPVQDKEVPVSEDIQQQSPDIEQIPEENEEFTTVKDRSLSTKIKPLTEKLKPMTDKFVKNLNSYVSELFKPTSDEAASPFERKKSDKTSRKSPLSND